MKIFRTFKIIFRTSLEHSKLILFNLKIASLFWCLIIYIYTPILARPFLSVPHGDNKNIFFYSCELSDLFVKTMTPEGKMVIMTSKATVQG